MRIAAIQTVANADVQHNLDRAAALISEAAAGGARLVVLPEYFCLMGRHDTDKLAIAEAPGEGPIQQFVAGQARAHGVWIVAGTVPLRTAAGDRAFNSCGVYSPGGELVARYDKIHLFAYDNGRERYDEAAVLEAGTQPVTFDADGHRVGLSICYDLRFPELYRAMMNPPCDLIVVPAAFTHTTGKAHWELLLRARAVENQCYVLASGQGGQHDNGRRTFGHSMLIDPWGEVVAVQAEGEGVVAGELDRERIALVRQQLPALVHRKL